MTHGRRRPSPGLALATALATVAGGWATLGAPSSAGAADAAAAAAPRDGLVAEYLMDETAGTVVHNSADGSTTGSDPLDATLVQGDDDLWGGGSLRFTGGSKSAGSWVRLPQDLLAGEQSATVSTELWADSSMLSTFHFLWNIGSDATDEYFFSSLNCGSGRRTLVGLKDAGTERLVQAPTCAAQAGRWTNVTVSVDGAADLARVFVDGQQVAEGAMPTTPGDVVAQTLNAIGRAPYPDPLFRGRIGAFRVYDRALGATEVAALSDADAAGGAAALLDGLTDRTVDGDVTLPTRGGQLTWASSDPATISPDGDVTLPPRGGAARTVELTATADVRGATASRTLTYTVEPTPALDTPYGYLMVHFIEDSQGYAEKIYLDVSRDDDPTVWEPLNDGRPILASNLGTTGVRDPYLTYNPETRTYYIIATDLRVFGGDAAGWDRWQRTGSRYLNVWESKDLVEWGPLRQVLVSPPTAGMSWAPEATWVPERGEFVVYWSSTLYAENDPNHTGSSYSRVVHGFTKDFETFDYQGPMIDTGANVIDTTVLQDGGTTYRLTKDNGTGRGIYFERTTATDWWKPTTSWTQIQSNIGQADYGAVEGPALFKDHDRDHWYLYVDVIPSTGYRPYETTDLDAGWTRLDAEATGFFMPPSTKHGGIISLTRAQYEHVTTADVARLVTQEVSATTTAGTAPDLPATAEVELFDGETAQAPITWKTEPGAFDEPGTVVVTGTVPSIANNLDDARGVGVPLRSSTAIDREVTATVTVTPAPAPTASTPPAVSGTAMVGRVLTASDGRWTSPVTVARQWLVGGRPVAGAVGTTYRVRPADVGRPVAVRVTATTAAGGRGESTSRATSAAAKAATRTTATRAGAAPRAGRPTRVRVAVGATGVRPTGQVVVRQGARVVARGQLSGGVVVLGARLPAGTHRLAVRYAGSAWAAPSSTTLTVKVSRP